MKDIETLVWISSWVIKLKETKTINNIFIMNWKNDIFNTSEIFNLHSTQWELIN